MRPRLIIIGLSAAALVGLWLVFLYLPTIRDQSRLQSQVLAAQTQLDDFKTTLAQLPLFIRTRADIRKRLQLANSNLYAKEDLIELFNELETTARMGGLRVIEITPPVSELLELNSLAPIAGEPQFLSLNIVMRGDYIAFGQYVEQLERADYFQSVQSCVIIGREANNGQVTFSLGFKALLGMTTEGAS